MHLAARMVHLTKRTDCHSEAEAKVRAVLASMMLGAGRERSEDDVKKDVGIRVLVEIGQEVKAGDPLLELYYREPADLKRATDQLNGAFAYGNAKGSPELILEALE